MIIIAVQSVVVMSRERVGWTWLGLGWLGLDWFGLACVRLRVGKIRDAAGVEVCGCGVGVGGCGCGWVWVWVWVSLEALGNIGELCQCFMETFFFFTLH